MNFPASADNSVSLPNPTGAATQNNPDHAGLHTSVNAAIIALENKVGTGSSTPASNTLLIGTGAGTSSWSGLTSSQLASILSDETGTGSVVFANAPTLILPKVDTINENTSGNGVTVGGVNLKAGVMNGTLPANAVATTNIAAGAVTSPKLADMEWYHSIPGTCYTSVIAGTWSNDAVGGTAGNPAELRLSNSGVSANDEVQYKAWTPAGTYRIAVYADKDVNRGIMQCSVNSAVVGSTLDCYAASRTNSVYNVFSSALSIAANQLSTINLKSTSKNASSSAFVLGIYRIELIRTA